MKNTFIDDEIVLTKPVTSSSTSSISTTRRPMFIETEVRTDSVTTRRMASAAANKSVHDVLEDTKTPTHDHHSTGYSYSNSNSYRPTLRSNTYDIPVTSQRNAHENDGSSRITSVLSAPSEFVTNIRSQLHNGIENIRDRLSELTGHGHESNLPTTDGTRFSRTSSSSSNGRSTGYNLRSRPIHSTPRDNDNEQHIYQRKSTIKHRKDDQHHGEIDEEEDDENGFHDKHSQNRFKKIIHYFKKLFRLPITIFDNIWDKSKALPLWLLLPLLILIGLYVLPPFVCKTFEHYHHEKVNDICRDVQYFAGDSASNAYKFVRHHTYERGRKNLQQVYHSFDDLKSSLITSLGDLYNSTTQSLKGSVDDVKDRVTDVVETTSENAKEYFDTGIQKINRRVEEFKQDIENYFGTRHALKPDEENQLRSLIHKIIDEYVADETGQADYALEANGGKVIHTRCEEYKDEPGQSVVKFLGIPIVHMSKHPDIIIKHGRMPGQCFPFKGDYGSIVIRLAVPVVPTEFVVEHLSKSISIVGHINSAPKNFTIYALKDKNDKEGIVLGRYFYDAENGPALQRFQPEISNVPVVEFIEIQITSNWGNPAYTCLYRFRVHGNMQIVTTTAA